MMFYWVKEERQNDMPCSVVKVSDFFFKEKSTKKDTLGSQKRSRLRAGEITEQNHSHQYGPL